MIFLICSGGFWSDTLISSHIGDRSHNLCSFLVLGEKAAKKVSLPVFVRLRDQDNFATDTAIREESMSRAGLFQSQNFSHTCGELACCKQARKLCQLVRI